MNNKKKIKGMRKILTYAHCSPNATEVERLRAELDMAIGLLIKQKMIIASLTHELETARLPHNIDPLIKHVKDW